MATIMKRHAIDRLTEAVKKAYPDDIAEIHNELFPENPATEDEAQADQPRLVKKILTHIDSGLEEQEILDLWNVIFPRHRAAWFDEEEGLMHYHETIEPVGQPE
jgi:hypothetical protein